MSAAIDVVAQFAGDARPRSSDRTTRGRGSSFELAAMPVWIGDEAYRILQREPAGIIRDLKGACMKPAIAEDAAVHGVTECRELFMAGVELSPVIEGPFGVIAADARFRDEPAPRDGA